MDSIFLILIIFCGEAKVTRSFKLTTDFEKAIYWIEHNNRKMYSVNGVTVLELGVDKLKLMKPSNIGVFVYYVKERQFVSNLTANYYAFLSKRVSGDLVKQSSCLRLRKKNGYIVVSIELYAKVNNRFATNFFVRKDLSKTAYQLEKIIREHI